MHCLPEVLEAALGERLALPKRKISTMAEFISAIPPPFLEEFNCEDWVRIKDFDVCAVMELLIYSRFIRLASHGTREFKPIKNITFAGFY
jgi:hypothetical protein